MSRIYIGRVALISLTVFLTGSPCWAAEQAWAFNQDSKLYGKMTVIVSKDNLRFIRPAKGLTTEFNGKTGEVFIYNSEFRKYFKTNLAQYEQLEASRLQFLEGYLSNLPMSLSTKAKPVKIAGFATQRFSLMSGHKGEATGKLDSDKVFSLSGVSTDAAELWTTSAFALSPNNQKAVHLIYQMPPKPGIPLKMTLINQRGGSTTMELNTVSVAQTTFPTAFMKPPANYTRATQYAGVVHQATAGSVGGVMKYFDAFQKSGLGN